jgi:hypothetical protein
MFPTSHDVILEEIKDSDTFKDLIENAVDSNEKIAGMADESKTMLTNSSSRRKTSRRTLTGWLRPK